MPWTGESFRARHAKHLSPAQSERAAGIANAILKGGGDEGVAIATGINRAKSKKPKTAKVRAPQPFGSLAP